jgi:hypothetical protein
LPEAEIGKLPNVALPVKTGTEFVVPPDVVTVVYAEVLIWTLSAKRNVTKGSARRTFIRSPKANE